MAAPILALDLSKYKTGACAYHSEAEHAFRSVPTSKAQLGDLLAEVQPRVVLIEACALAGWVHDLGVELSVECVAANTASEAWKFKHAKTQDRPRRRPAARLAVRTGPTPDGGDPRQAGAGLTGVDRSPPAARRPARRRPSENHSGPLPRRSARPEAGPTTNP